MSDTKRTECLFNRAPVQTHFLKSPEHPHWNRAGLRAILSWGIQTAHVGAPVSPWAAVTPWAAHQSCRGQEWGRGLTVVASDTNILFSGFSVTETCSLSHVCQKDSFLGKSLLDSCHVVFVSSVMDVLYKVVFFQCLAELTGCEEIKELGLKARWQSYESALWLFLWMKWSQSAVVFSVCICHPVGGSRVRASCYSGLFRPLWLHLRPRLWFSAFLWARPHHESNTCLNVWCTFNLFLIIRFFSLQ